MDKAEVKKLQSSLLDRLNSLSNLYERKVVNRKILGRQLQQMIGSPQGRSLSTTMIGDDLEARIFLARLEDPVQWRDDSSGSEKARRARFYEQLVKIFTKKNKPDKETLECLLEAAAIPHFAGFTRDPDDKTSKTKKKSRVSVLD